MSQSFGAHTVLHAEWCLGMAGTIEWIKNSTGEKFRLHHTIQDGKRLEKWEDDGWKVVSFRISNEELMELMNRDDSSHHWTMPAFIGWWAGAAAGIEIGSNRERNRQTTSERPMFGLKDL